MSDRSVAASLRSDAPLVVIEAPAGCGKTHQGAEYANEAGRQIGNGRVLVLTHTHAASDVFAERANGSSRTVEVATLDSHIVEIARVYHQALGLPVDTAAWARSQGSDGYASLAGMVAKLLARAPMISSAIARRYPIIICDEHQDATPNQHAIIMAVHEAGARARIFGDPMQRIFPERTRKGQSPPIDTWEQLRGSADVFDKLDTPHRWSDGSSQLGDWVLGAREALQSARPIDLRQRPDSVHVVMAENVSQSRKQYQIAPDERRPLDFLRRQKARYLVLASQNNTVQSLRPFFSRTVPMWEGHTREALTTLADTVSDKSGDADEMAAALVTFVQSVATGFSETEFTSQFIEEVSTRCSRTRRGKPAHIQAIAQCVVDSPDHRGVATALRKLDGLMRSEPTFAKVKLDRHREFFEATRLGDFDDPTNALAEISRRRAHSRPQPPQQAVSTIHKAKGLQCDHVFLMPCDGNHFRDTDKDRCLLYVAISRPKCSLTLVVSGSNPSPLFTV